MGPEMVVVVLDYIFIKVTNFYNFDISDALFRYSTIQDRPRKALLQPGRPLGLADIPLVAGRQVLRAHRQRRPLHIRDAVVRPFGQEVAENSRNSRLQLVADRQRHRLLGGRDRERPGKGDFAGDSQQGRNRE